MITPISLVVSRIAAASTAGSMAPEGAGADVRPKGHAVGGERPHPGRPSFCSLSQRTEVFRLDVREGPPWRRYDAL